MILSVLTFILGVVGSYFISRNFELKTQIKMDINSFEIINDNIGLEGIILQCNGMKIDTLTKTSIMFWNSGRKCITKDEILGKQCIEIEFDQNVEIFKCKDVKRNELSNNISVSNYKNIVNVKFDYLKPGNGAVIDILHNGTIDKAIKPYLNLKTYNKSDIIKVETSVGWDSLRRKKENENHVKKILMAMFCFCFFITATVLSIFFPLFSIDSTDIAVLVALVMEFVCGGLFILMLLYLKTLFYIKPKDLY